MRSTEFEARRRKRHEWKRFTPNPKQRTRNVEVNSITETNGLPLIMGEANANLFGAALRCPFLHHNFNSCRIEKKKEKKRIFFFNFVSDKSRLSIDDPNIGKKSFLSAIKKTSIYFFAKKNLLQSAIRERKKRVSVSFLLNRRLPSWPLAWPQNFFTPHTLVVFISQLSYQHSWLFDI